MAGSNFMLSAAPDSLPTLSGLFTDEGSFFASWSASNFDFRSLSDIVLDTAFKACATGPAGQP